VGTVVVLLVLLKLDIIAHKVVGTLLIYVLRYAEMADIWANTHVMTEILKMETVALTSVLLRMVTSAVEETQQALIDVIL
jgi:hypothetical protein